MDDARQLYVRLAASLALFGCDAAEPSAASEAVPASADTTKRAKKHPSPNLTPDTPGLGRCPHGDWCTSSEVARSLLPAREQDRGAPAMGCTSVLDPPNAVGIDRADPVFVGLPFDRGTIALFSHRDTPRKRESMGRADLCCYEWVTECPGGRPLIVDGHARVAELRRLAPAPTLANPTDVQRSRIASAWLADAQAEHASIASFARAARELHTVGAPAELVEAHHAAARDELRHTSLCLEIAARLGHPHTLDEIEAPPIRAASLLTVAENTFREGVIGETVAALAARRAHAIAGDRMVRQAWAIIARDEERHAALAWRVIAWTVERGGDEIWRALLRLAESLTPSRELVATTTRPDVQTQYWGRLDSSALVHVRRDAWSHVIAPLSQQLAA